MAPMEAAMPVQIVATSGRILHRVDAETGIDAAARRLM